MSKPFKLLIAALLFYCASTSAQIHLLPFSDRDDAVQYFQPLFGESLLLPVRVGQGLTLEFSNNIIAASIDADEHYSLVLYETRKGIQLWAHRPTNTRMTVITEIGTYSFKIKVQNNAAQHVVVKPYASASKMSRNVSKKIDNSFSENSFGSMGFRADGSYINRAYFFNPNGDKELRPSRAVDNGVFTVFEFKGDIPAIYRVGKNGKESLVNITVEGNYAIIHEVAEQFTLRLNKRALCIFNRSKYVH